ncbi:peptidylprolyl isomerase [Lutibacter sp. HS1-25]|uniref:peptidylprolyl isomerase n=1 Tax=Lutibacter sp. HS1-25 TaxID=2485000 RepID=UPI001011B4A8|nr:peptidylprolyl isomerase [Lutibacter sp. HS1-25]RXP57629.1 peptidylprolyl isomerase [Lutibacter sp. HS1-25]
MMHEIINNLKYIKFKNTLILTFLLCFAGLNAQTDSTYVKGGIGSPMPDFKSDTVTVEAPPKVISEARYNNPLKVKIDGVAVVIGDNIVLNSDIDKFKKELELRMEGGDIGISNCGILEEIMTQKLIAHMAVIDSVAVSEAEVNEEVDRNIDYFKQQLGSMEKVVAMYGFNDEDDLRKELYEIQKEQLLIRRESASITENIDVTPEEVRTYFKNLEVDGELPEFSTEIVLAQIVKTMKPTDEETERVIDKLNEIKKEVEEGFSFRLKAIINSDDPAVSSKGPGSGGQYTITRQSGFIKEFKEVAFSLDEGQVSDPFKSSFGYHIILVDKIKGQERVVSHILIQPKISSAEMKAAEDELKSIRDKILNGEITFAEAVLQYSDDKENKTSGGLIMNPETNDTKFDLTRMDPQLYNRVSSLKPDEITQPFYEEVRGGDKMFKMIKVVGKIDAHTANFSDDYEKIQQLALQKKKEETINKWAQEKLMDTYIKINSPHTECDFEKNWKKEK